MENQVHQEATETPETPLATSTETDTVGSQPSPAPPTDLRIVALVVGGERVLKAAVGNDPLYIATAPAWQPNKAAIEAKWPWLCQMMGTDALIKIALAIMAM